MRHYPPLKPRNTAGHWSATRDRAAQAKFRKAVMERAGGRCQHVERGQRCPVTWGLQAHHTQPGNNDPATGLLLCRPHHKAMDPHAR